MDGFMNEDFLTLPLILGASELQSVGLVNYNGFQLELPKDQAMPLVILENADCSPGCPLILPANLSGKDEAVNHTNSRPGLVLETQEVNEGDQEIDPPSHRSNITDSSHLNDLSDLIEQVILYKCKLCTFKSSEKNALSSHLQDVHLKNAKQNEGSSVAKVKKGRVPPEKTAYMCGKCSEAFGSFAEWKSHLASVHKITMNIKTILENSTLNGGPPIDLNNKKPKLEPLTQLPTEERKVFDVPNKEKKIVCTVRSCLVRLSSRESIEKHRECHAGPRHFACPHCSQPFRKWYDCANHLWTSHSQDVDLFSCPNCEYKTALKTKFKNHIKIHSDEKGYMCSECGKTFKQALQLRNHQVFHLKAIGSPNIPNWSKKQECPQCKRNFYDGKSLKKHIQSVHSNLRPYVCQVCGHTSANKNRLGIHLRQHTGEKPFSCPLCEFTTGDQNCLRRHTWRHSHVRPYSCPHCSYSCIQSNSLKNHIKALHPGASGVLSCLQCSFTSLSQSSLESHTAKAHGAGKLADQYPVLMTDDDSQNGLHSS